MATLYLEWAEQFIFVLREKIARMFLLEIPFGRISRKLIGLHKCMRVASGRCDTGTSEQKSAAESFICSVLQFLCYLDVKLDEFDALLNIGTEMVFMKTKADIETKISALIKRAGSFGFPVTDEDDEDDEDDKEEEARKKKEKEKHQVVGIEEELSVMKRLCGAQLNLEVILIMGPEGIGKTTLANKFYNNLVVVNQFPCRLWVTLKQNDKTKSSTKQIRKRVQIMVGSTMVRTMQSTEVNMKSLCHFLRYKKYLIVMDDLQTLKEWNMLEKMLPETSNGSRILITTRNRDYMDSHPNWHNLEKRLLSEEEGWELFEVNLGYRVPVEVEHIGKEIVSKCMGLPPRILDLGHLLSQKAANKEHWSMVQNQMSGEQVTSYFNLKMTANSLPPKLKQCLFYFGLFPQDYDIPARRLIVLWVAEGIVQEKENSIEQPEYLAEKLLSKLIRHNLIQVAKWKRNGKVRTCRMNYFLREKWLSEAIEANFLSKSNSPSGSDETRRLSDLYDRKDLCFSHIHGSDTAKKLCFQHYYKNLLTYLSFDSREGPDPGDDIGNFLRTVIAKGCFKKLRVIDFEGVFQPKLPDSLGKLVELRYLGLRSTYIEKLPSSIGKLTKLQTLDLKTTKISTLPTSLWKMKELRHLYLSESYRCRFLPPPFDNSLVNLQTLWGAFVDDGTLVRGGLDRLINLRKLGLVCQLNDTKQGELAEWITKLEHLASLRLRSIDKTFVLPSKLYIKPLTILDNLSSLYVYGRLEKTAVVYSLPQCLNEITLSSSRLSDDPMTELEKLPNLRILNLYSSSFMGKTMVCSSGGFPMLVTLNIWVLEDLETWFIEQGALSALKELEVRSCKKLKVLPDGVKHLRHCRKLKLTKMPHEFKLRVAENQGEDWWKVAHIPSIIIKD